MKTDLTEQISRRVRSSKYCVFLTEDFLDLADQKKVETAIIQLVGRKILSSIGSGVYARVRKNSITHEVMLDAPGGFEQVALQALDRLGIKWIPGTATTAYTEGASQIPVTTYVRVFGIEKPSIVFKDYKLHYE